MDAARAVSNVNLHRHRRERRRGMVMRRVTGDQRGELLTVITEVGC